MSWARSKVGELSAEQSWRAGRTLRAPSSPIRGNRRPALVLSPPRRATPSDTENNGQAPQRGNGAACAGALSTSARELGAPHGGTVHPTAARYTPRRYGTPHGGTHHGGGAREKPSPRGVGRRLYNDTPLKPAVMRLSVRPLHRAHTAASWNK